MKVEIKTKFGVLNYDMPDEKVSRLLTYAAKFAAGEPLRKQPVKKPPEPKPAAENEIIRAKSRVETMFGEKKTWDMPAAGTAPQQVPKIKPYKPATGYTGFIIAKCDRCGAERGFCTKAHITKSLCKCGHDIELGEMTVAHLDCGCCGKSFTYRTNIKQPVFVHDCIECGTPIIAKRNATGTTYVTYRDRELMGTYT